MNAIKRSITFSMLKCLIRRGNVTIIAASDFRVPTRRNNYQMHGYRIQLGDWSQDVIILPIDDDKPTGPSAISAVRSVLTLIGFTVSPIMIMYATNRGDCPMRMPYMASERKQCN